MSKKVTLKSKVVFIQTDNEDNKITMNISFDSNHPNAYLESVMNQLTNTVYLQNYTKLDADVKETVSYLPNKPTNKKANKKPMAGGFV